MNIKVVFEFEGELKDIVEYVGAAARTPTELVTHSNREMSEDFPSILSSTENSFSRVGAHNVIFRLSVQEAEA